MRTLHRDLQYINPNDIAYDKNNPRGLSESQIMNNLQFSKLVSSIKKYGILEPLIVKSDESNPSKYVLIDGERRWRASLESELEEVPVLVAKDDTDGRILAYQVHMLRENWDKPSETKAIKKIMSDLKSEKPTITDAEIKQRIEEITAHKPHELADILKLIKYDDETIKKVIANELNMSYLVQIEASFISPLKRFYPEVNNKYGEDKIRNILIQKALDGKLVNTRFLMDKFKVVFANTKHKDEIEKLLFKFLEKKNKSIKETYDEYESAIGQGKKSDKQKQQMITKKTKQKTTNVSKKAEVSDTFSPRSIKVTKKQQTLIGDVRTKIERIGSSFSKNEYDYISEAIFCLEKHCFKAATLMIWSSGISRILKIISSDIADFNKSSKTMYDGPKSVWKYFSKSFLKNASTVEDIRVNSNDIQLLCYLVFKGIITSTQFNKLQANYKTRCDCAHPTDIDLSPNETISIFENIYNLIFNNPKLA